MRYLLLCFINNRFEFKLVERASSIISLRQKNCDVKKIKLSNGSISDSIISACQKGITDGYNHIVIQAATLVYSINLFDEISIQIKQLQDANPHIKMIIFSPEQLIEVCAEEIERNVYHESLQDNPFKETPPDEIQKKSFEFIAQRLGSKYKDEDTKSVVVRVIHAIADFSIERLLRFSPDGVVRAKEALKNNCSIITDVNMVSAGLSLRFKNRTISSISQSGVMEYAEKNILTRSAAGIELLKDKIEGSVIAIGNAPTSLIQLLSIIKSTGIRPACVVGVPVGFVGAAESKELLMASDVPFITIKGNRGGSPIAVAIVNAL